MGRRRQIRPVAPPDEEPLTAPDEPSTASTSLVARRLLFWCGTLLVYRARCIGRRLIGRHTTRWRARQFRLLLQSGGTVSQKLGQQLSIRTDVLDPVLCNELKRLLDDAPPMLLVDTVAILEAVYRRPLAEVFRVFDPEPIGSASIACVYQAELLNGDKVAVKVRRPGVMQLVDADLRIINGFAWLAEALALVRAGSATSFAVELKHLLTEETHLRMEAKFTELFRADSRRIKHVSAPRLHHALCTDAIMVSDFCSGAFLSEFMVALENDQADELQAFAERGFDLRKIASALAQTFYWEVFEGQVFHADIHPANVIVRPNNTLVLIDFGSCGHLSNRFRATMKRFFRYIMDGDVGMAARCCLEMCEPIPMIDTHACTADLRRLFQSYYLSIRSKHTDWTEKTSGRVFIEAIRGMASYGLNANPELVRYCRAALLFDTIVFRLHPTLNPIKELERYEEQRAERDRHKLFKEMTKRATGPLPRDWAAMHEMVSQGRGILAALSRYADVPRFAFFAGMNKVSFVVAAILRASVGLALLLVLWALAGAGLTALTTGNEYMGVRALMRSALVDVTHSPFYWTIAAVTLLITGRKIVMKIERAEVRNAL